MRRREFIAALGGVAVAWPRGTQAQQAERIRRVGVLMMVAPSDLEGQARLNAFEQAIQERGWVNGRNVRIDHRWTTGDADQRRMRAKELIELQPDVILAHATPAVAALLRETRSIPIVFVSVVDPVGQGFIESLSRPKKNLTGFINLESSLGNKWLELLKEVAPNVVRAMMIFNPHTAAGAGQYFFRPFEAAAASFGVEPIAARVQNADDMERAAVSLNSKPGGGLIVIPDVFTTSNREQLVSLATRHGIPAVYPFRFFAASGGLLSYGTDIVDQFRLAALYIDRILRGAQAVDLPIQAPSKYELVINLRTAKALGIQVPPTLLARADEVLE
jgi:putative tryptophan/tyrosine transport system substrate-binding protein